MVGIISSTTASGRPFDKRTTSMSKPVLTKASDIACYILSQALACGNSIRSMLQSRHVSPLPKHISTLLVFSALWNQAHGQNTFLKTFGGASHDYANALAVDTTGDMVVAGFTTSFGEGGSDVLLAKWNTSGSLVWAKTLGWKKSKNKDAESAAAVAIDASGNIVIAGSASKDWQRHISGRHTDVLLAKWDTNGSLIWANTLGAIKSYNTAHAVAIDSSGNIVTAGSTESFGAGSTDVLLTKWDASGSPSWAKTLGGTSRDYATTIAIDGNDNIVFAGFTQSFRMGYLDTLLAKLDANGSLTWAKTLEGASEAQTEALAIDSSNNIVLAGSTTTFAAAGHNVFFTKWDANGSLIWAKAFGGKTSSNHATALAIDSSGNIVVTGYTITFETGGYGVLLAKLDENGSLIWANDLGWKNDLEWKKKDKKNDQATTLAIDSSGNIVVAGYTESLAYYPDVLLSRMRADGTLYNCSYVQTANLKAITQTEVSISTPRLTNLSWTNSIQLSCTNEMTVSTISNAVETDHCLPFPTTSVATTVAGTTWETSSQAVIGVGILTVIGSAYVIWNIYFKTTRSPRLIDSSRKHHH